VLALSANATPIFNIGRVVTPAGDPVPGATVNFYFGNDDGDRLPNDSTGGDFTATTNEDGIFVFYESIDDLTLYEFKRGTVGETATTAGTSFSASVELKPDLNGLLGAAGFSPGLIDIVLALLSGISGVEIPKIISTDIVMQGCVECIEAQLKQQEGQGNLRSLVVAANQIPCPIPEPSTYVLTATAFIALLASRHWKKKFTFKQLVK